MSNVSFAFCFYLCPGPVGLLGQLVHTVYRCIFQSHPQLQPFPHFPNFLISWLLELCWKFGRIGTSETENESEKTAIAKQKGLRKWQARTMPLDAIINVLDHSTSKRFDP